MKLNEFGSLYFVRRAFGLPGVYAPPADGPIAAGTSKAQVAQAIAQDVRAAEIKSAKDIIEVQVDAAAIQNAPWTTLYELNQAVLDSAAVKGDSPQNPVAITAFGDYMAIRWIYQCIRGNDGLARRPRINVALPPTYDNADKLMLANCLIGKAAAGGFTLSNNDQATLRNASPSWGSIYQVRDTLLKVIALFALVAVMLSGARPAGAQLIADPTDKDNKFIRLFAFYDRDKKNILGAFSGKFALPVTNVDKAGSKGWMQQFTTQWDFGSLGKKTVTASGKSSSDESTLSKNSGSATYSFILPIGADGQVAPMRASLDLGVESKRYRQKALVGGSIVEQGETTTLDPLINAGFRYAGGTNQSGDTGMSTAYLGRLNFALANAITPDLDPTGVPGRKVNMGFVEPLGAIWFLFSPAEAGADHTPFYRWTLRVQGGMMYAVGAKLGRGQFDIGLAHFFGPNSGLELRMFEGYFDHNINDKKSVVSLNLMQRF